MAHNLATINGRIAMAYQGETPWHKLGTRMEAGVVSVADAMAAAALDFEVKLQPMFLGNGQVIPRKFAVTRDEADKFAVLGTASDWYKPIQYSEAFGLFQPAVEEFGLTVEAAGALGDGEKAWMLFKLPETLTPVDGDTINGYGLAMSGHDGKTATSFLPTPIRVVCQNTLNAAIGQAGKGRVFSISHIGDVQSYLAEARELVTNVLQTMRETGDTFAQLAERKMSPREVVNYIEAVFPAAKDGSVSEQLKAKRAAVADLCWTGVGADLALAATDGEMNAWAAYNAVTEYFDHVAPGIAKSESGKAKANSSAIFGVGADIKLLALRKAQELVAA